MRKLWILLGRILFWLSWPLLFMYLRIKLPRTRVIIVSQAKILMVKGWLGSGKWSLPGGGLHKGEAAKQGAVREVAEETGIALKANSLQKIDAGSISHRGLKYKYISFYTSLDRIPPTKKQAVEITTLQWIDAEKALKSPDVADDVRTILAAWYQQP